MPAQGIGNGSCRIHSTHSISKAGSHEERSVGTVLILANGVWGESVDARSMAERADFVIAADGGYAKALAARVPVNMVVGDLDSLDDASLRTLAGSSVEVRRYPADKDWTDLELAIDEALKRTPGKITILGALGNRIDHTLTNVHLLERGLDAGVSIELESEAESVTLTGVRRELADAHIGDRVSLVPISESVRVSTTGLRFALYEDVLYRAASRGVSNLIDDVPAVVSVSSGRLLVIHTRTGART
jgi:thiamine pyrophosphokinase